MLRLNPCNRHLVGVAVFGKNDVVVFQAVFVVLGVKLRQIRQLVIDNTVLNVRQHQILHTGCCLRNHIIQLAGGYGCTSCDTFCDLSKGYAVDKGGHFLCVVFQAQIVFVVAQLLHGNHSAVLAIRLQCVQNFLYVLGAELVLPASAQAELGSIHQTDALIAVAENNQRGADTGVRGKHTLRQGDNALDHMPFCQIFAHGNVRAVLCCASGHNRNRFSAFGKQVANQGVKHPIGGCFLAELRVCLCQTLHIRRCIVTIAQHHTKRVVGKNLVCLRVVGILSKLKNIAAFYGDFFTQQIRTHLGNHRALVVDVAAEIRSLRLIYGFPH